MRIPRLAVGGWSRVGRGRMLGSDAWVSYAPRHVQWGARKGAFFAVADSVGRAGEVGQLSRRAIEVAMRSYYQDAHANVALSLWRAVQRANQVLLGDSRAFGPQFGGATMCAVAVFDQHAEIAHVGDTRAFLVRGQQVWTLTDDHSWLAQHGLGSMPLAQRRYHPYRWALSRALGRSPNVDVDIRRVGLLPGDTLVICSDGVTDILSAAEIGRLVHNRDSAAAASGLVEHASRAGADDSVTCVVVRILPSVSMRTPRSFPSLRSAFRLTPPGGRRAFRQPAMVPALYAVAAALMTFAFAILAAS